MGHLLSGHESGDAHAELLATQRQPELELALSGYIKPTVTITPAQVKSAVLSSSTPGVFVAMTPALEHAGRSMLLKPTAMLHTAFSPGQRASSCASTRSTRVVPITAAAGSGLDDHREPDIARQPDGNTVQIARVMGKQLKTDVGPWSAYLRIVRD